MAHPKSQAGYRLGIVNPLTLVGNELKTVLRERSFPYVRLALLDSTGEAGGALTDIGDEPAVVTPIDQDGLDDLDLVFFCGSAEANAPWIARHVEDDFIAVDLSQPTTAEDARLLVASLNLDSLPDGENLLVSPHPIAVAMALVLGRVSSLSPIESCVTTVTQPASAFDAAGVEELAAQTVSVLSAKGIPQEVFGRQLAFNQYPAAEHHEELILSQLRTLLDTRAELSLFVNQATIFHNHTLAMFIRTRDAISTDQILAVVRASEAFDTPEGDQQFGTIDAAGRDEVLVAEVRADASVKNGFWVWAVCDNLRRGAALNAVLIAEKALFGAGAPN
jgi:aspartate-semialdehyde dehydrogenase